MIKRSTETFLDFDILKILIISIYTCLKRNDILLNQMLLLEMSYRSTR